MFKRIFIAVLIGTTLFISSFFLANYFFSQKNSISVQTPVVSSTPIATTSPTVVTKPSLPTKKEEVPNVVTTTPSVVTTTTQTEQKVLLQVPFSPQAPFGDWADPRQEDGCEEASVVMAWRWAHGQGLTRQEALNEIIAMSEWEKEQYGNSRDTSAADTFKRLLKEYYGYTRGRVEYDITIDDVKAELAKGNILIIPFDGQILANPNFKAPGPERHMLVVKGYDDLKQQFITNDPGTRLGEGFVYPYTNFTASFRDYETGNHVPIEGRESAMIVVEPIPSF